jgi:hypothetical protein
LRNLSLGHQINNIMINKIKKELTDAKFMKFSGYGLMSAFKKNSWRDTREYLESQEVKNTKEVLDYVKTNMYAVQINIPRTNLCNRYVNTHLESPGMVKNLVKYLPKTLVEKHNLFNYPWFTFLPVDYNYGDADEYIIMCLSKDKAALEFVEGDY